MAERQLKLCLVSAPTGIFLLFLSKAYAKLNERIRAMALMSSCYMDGSYTQTSKTKAINSRHFSFGMLHKGEWQVGAARSLPAHQENLLSSPQIPQFI